MPDMPYYPIKDLSDVLSKFRAELSIAIADVNKRIDELESKILQGTTGAPTQGAGTPEETEEMERTARDHATSTIVMIAQARRAVYGYAMLLDSMGLSKDQKQTVRQVEYMISAMLRLQQTITIVQMALSVLESDPYLAAFRLVVAGGTLAATFMYSSRALGG